MTQDKDPKTIDRRPLSRKILTGVLAAILAVAVPVAKFANCDKGLEVPPSDRELSYGHLGQYVGDKVPTWVNYPEGLRYLPTSVVLSLKRPGTKSLSLTSEKLFAKPERFGLVPNPEGGELPLGIVSDDRGEIKLNAAPMIGLTCGACHVGAIAKDGKWMIVPGSPNFMSVNVFFGDMISSLAATLANPAAFDDLWKSHAKLSGIDPTSDTTRVTIDPSQIQKILDGQGLQQDYPDQLADAWPTKQSLNTRAKLAAYLSARLVQLISKAKAGSDDSGAGPLGTSNPWSTTRALLGTKFAHAQGKMNAEGGPVTAPDIWNYGERKHVFWAQATNSMMERNLAQGLALLGDVNWETFETTVSPTLLQDIQKMNEWVIPPTWPKELLGDTDRLAASKGCVIFKEKCSSCHEYTHEVSRGSLEFRVYDVGTDSSYCQGVNSTVTNYPSVPDLVRPVAAAVKKEAMIKENIVELDEVGRTPVVWQNMTCNELPARSLEGAWATPPYLHNGSVSSMEDLLKPVSQRSINFYVGSIEYDVQSLGFTSLQSPNTTLVDVTRPGLSNKGHEFTIDSESDRYSLMQYMHIHVDGDKCE